MNAEALLARLRGVRRSGAGWITRCPAHEDRSPSLSVGEGRGGKILLHCFGGCTSEAVCDSLGLNLADLFPEPGKVQLKPRALREAEKRIQSLRSRLTPRERVLPVTVVYCDPENLNAGIARALAVAVQGEVVQVVLEPAR